MDFSNKKTLRYLVLGALLIILGGLALLVCFIKKNRILAQPYPHNELDIMTWGVGYPILSISSILVGFLFITIALFKAITYDDF